MSAGHDHSHDDGGMRPLTGAIALTAVIFCAELTGGWWTGSLALIADATHQGSLSVSRSRSFSE